MLRQTLPARNLNMVQVCRLGADRVEARDLTVFFVRIVIGNRDIGSADHQAKQVARTTLQSA